MGVSTRTSTADQKWINRPEWGQLIQIFVSNLLMDMITWNDHGIWSQHDQESTITRHLGSATFGSYGTFKPNVASTY